MQPTARRAHSVGLDTSNLRMQKLARRLWQWLDSLSMDENCGSITPKRARRAAAAAAAAAVAGVAEGSGTLLAVPHAAASAEAVVVSVTAEEGAEAGAGLGTEVAGADVEDSEVPPIPTKGQSRTSKDQRRRLMTSGRMP